MAQQTQHLLGIIFQTPIDGRYLLSEHCFGGKYQGSFVVICTSRINHGSNAVDSPRHPNFCDTRFRGCHSNKTPQLESKKYRGWNFRFFLGFNGQGPRKFTLENPPIQLCNYFLWRPPFPAEGNRFSGTPGEILRATFIYFAATQGACVNFSLKSRRACRTLLDLKPNWRSLFFWWKKPQ